VRLAAIEQSATSVANVTSAAAAGAEETAATSSEMASQAGTLSALVGRFRLAVPDPRSAEPRARHVQTEAARRRALEPTAHHLEDMLVM
jgi:hypothetical protein